MLARLRGAAIPVTTAFGTSSANWTKGTTTSAPRWYAVGSEIRLMGTLTCGGSGAATVFTGANGLPANRRPAAERNFSATLKSGGAVFNTTVTIGADGSITAGTYYDNTSPGNTDILHLDGISFLAEI